MVIKISPNNIATPARPPFERLNPLKISDVERASTDPVR
jgi:hypothetical protein